MRKQQKRKAKRRRRTGLSLIAVMVLLICLVVVVKRSDLENDYDDKLAKKAVLEAQIAEQEERTKELEEKKAYMQTKKYIEEVARDVLGLVYKDEIIFKQEE